MRFEPKTEKEIAEAMLLPDGEYDFVVVKAEDTKSKKTGVDMIKVTIGVYQPDGTQRLITDYLMGSFPRKLRRFAEGIGLLAQYEMGELHSEECEGRSGRCKVVIKHQDDYDPKNEVKDYVVNRASKSKPAPAAHLPTTEDDIPF